MIKQSTFARRVLRELEDAGWKIESVDIGEDKPIKTHTVLGALDVFRSVDECYVNVRKGDEKNWLRFIWQGPDDRYPDGEEVLSDHGVGLSPIIDPLYEVLN